MEAPASGPKKHHKRPHSKSPQRDQSRKAPHYPPAKSAVPKLKPPPIGTANANWALLKQVVAKPSGNVGSAPHRGGGRGRGGPRHARRNGDPPAAARSSSSSSASLSSPSPFASSSVSSKFSSSSSLASSDNDGGTKRSTLASSRAAVPGGKKTKKSKEPLRVKWIPPFPFAMSKDDVARIHESERGLTPQLALDCEMVGYGPEGRKSMLARATIVNNRGVVVYDAHVLPTERVVDYRTKYSGIRPPDLLAKNGAKPFAVVQKEISDMVMSRILVGHGLNNDLQVLLLKQPFAQRRDTAKWRPMQWRKGKPQRLQALARRELGLAIQTGEHDSAEDARAAMLIYLKYRKKWDSEIRTAKKPTHRGAGVANDGGLGGVSLACTPDMLHGPRVDSDDENEFGLDDMDDGCGDDDSDDDGSEDLSDAEFDSDDDDGESFDDDGDDDDED